MDHDASLKRELRAAVREGRSTLSDEAAAVASKRITKRLRDLAVEHNARRVCCYLSVRGEPDTSGFLSWAKEREIEVLLPASRPDGLLDWILLGDAGTEARAFGIHEPLGEALSPEALSTVDLMLIPAAAVDSNGHRLGWGRGYFDRCLAGFSTRPPVYAVVHDHEVLERVPHEPHDVPVDGVVTPERTLIAVRHAKPRENPVG